MKYENLLCDHIPYILPLMCFDMLGISCRLLLVPGSFQYLHMKADIPTERLPQNSSGTSFLYADISFLPLFPFEKYNSGMTAHELLRNNGAVYSFAFERKLIVHFFFSFPC